MHNLNFVLQNNVDACLSCKLFYITRCDENTYEKLTREGEIRGVF